MTKIRFFGFVICIHLSISAVYGGLLTESTDSSPVKDDQPFFSQSGAGGVCRGFSHLAGAPLVVPLSCLYGFVVPFQGDPEQNGTTNMATYAVAQAIAAPAYIGINTLAGSGACVIEATKGVIEILSLGYYGRETADNKKDYDSRPYFIQLAKRILGHGNESRFMSLIVPEEEETEEEEEVDITA